MGRKLILLSSIVAITIGGTILCTRPWIAPGSMPLPATQRLTPISILKAVAGTDDVLKEAGGAGETIAPGTKFEADLPHEILDAIKRDSGQNVGSVTVQMVGFHANNVQPDLSGITELKANVPFVDRGNWSYSLVAHVSVPTALGSANAFTLQLRMSTAIYEIHGTCIVEKLGDGPDGIDQMGGVVQWLGPFRIQ